MAEYAVSNKIDDEPAFTCWVHSIFKKRDRIIAKAKTKYWRNTHKYGVRLKKTAAEALELDRRTRSRQKSPKRKLKVVRLNKSGEVRLMNSGAGMWKES